MPDILFSIPDMPWLFPIAIIELLGGSALFGLSLTQRWVNWCSDKPFAIPYLVFAAGYRGNRT